MIYLLLRSGVLGFPLKIASLIVLICGVGVLQNFGEFFFLCPIRDESNPSRRFLHVPFLLLLFLILKIIVDIRRLDENNIYFVCCKR